MKQNQIALLGAMLLLACPAVAQKITEKAFFQNQHQYIKEAKVGEATIRQKRIPKSAFPTQIETRDWFFYYDLQNIQEELDALQADFVVQKKVSYAWQNASKGYGNIPKRLEKLQKEKDKLDTEPYKQEWEVYATFFQKQDSTNSAQLWQKYNAEKQARQTQYAQYLALCEKNLVSSMELDHLKQGRQAFPDSVALRECYVLKLAQSGDVKLALQEQEPYLQTGTNTARTRAQLFYERVKKDYVKPPTPSNTTKTSTSTPTKTTTTRRIKTTKRR